MFALTSDHQRRESKGITQDRRTYQRCGGLWGKFSGAWGKVHCQAGGRRRSPSQYIYNLTVKLDNMRDVYDGLQDLLAHTAYKLSEGLEDEYAKMLDVMYFPQLVISCASRGNKGRGTWWRFQWRMMDNLPLWWMDGICSFKQVTRDFLRLPKSMVRCSWNCNWLTELDEYYGDVYSLIIGCACYELK